MLRWGSLVGIALAIVVAHGAVAEAKPRRRASRVRREPPVPSLTREGLPNVKAAAAMVVDMDSGVVLYGKNPDTPRFIASTTKIFVAMVVRKHGIDLDGVTQITTDDRVAAQGGARTKLFELERYRNLDLLKAMLIASDNRAPHALGRAIGLDDAGLIAEMNALARQLGLKNTSFTDASGLHGNTSTARDMAVAMRAFMKDPLLAEIASTRTATVDAVEARRPKRINYGNTNRLLHNNHNRIYGGKTGYTDEALYCLVVASDIGGRRVCTVILGAHGELTRYGDYARLQSWLTAGAALASATVAAAADATAAAAATISAGEGEIPVDE
jgi:D-alanyl-D-alanine endopeptidase (penicillin-binding protein 7)